MHPIIREKIPDLAGIASPREKARHLRFGGRGPVRPGIDLVVEFEPMTPVEHARACFGLAEDLARAFGRKIDLVELSAVWMRSSAGR